jgi:hypothetical protein
MPSAAADKLPSLADRPGSVETIGTREHAAVARTTGCYAHDKRKAEIGYVKPAAGIQDEHPRRRSGFPAGRPTLNKAAVNAWVGRSINKRYSPTVPPSKCAH